MFNFPPEVSKKLQALAKELLHDKLSALGLNPDANTHRVTVKDFPEFENYWEWILDKDKPGEHYLFSMLVDVIEHKKEFYFQQHLFDVPMTLENREVIIGGFRQDGESRMSSLKRLK